ncbi:MAG TPA: aldehyde dehydrogenase [Chloroflexota bacterium]|nr:aldehyde dehydrogenase [Chloroflexota bacterium]HZU04757.1 aldehyde dehydrogenase [Chloroflexota bacterium]
MTAVAPQIPVKQLFIDNRWVAPSSGRTFADVNPATGEVLAHIAEADATDVDRAVRAARRAFDEGPWRQMRAAERSALLRRVGELILQRKDELIRLESLDTGKPVRESSTLDIPRSALNFIFFAEYLTKVTNDCVPVDNQFLHYELRDPVGVAALITPWNFPLLLATWKVGPCLAAGNTCVLKPASYTPLTALALAEIVAEAGLPEGVFNVVTGPGTTVGTALVSHPMVNLVSFTGETTTGQTIMQAAAPGLKRVSFELGGKAPNLIFASADLDAAVAGSLRSAFFNQGEVCLATPRFLVEESIYDAFLEKFVAAARALRLGDPLDPATEMGPLVSQPHYERVTRYVQLGEEEGARLVTGGRRPPGLERGYYLEPTIFTDVRPDMRICREEIFGPVVTIQPVKTEEEAIRLANDTPYGLNATIWTNDLRQAHRVAARLVVGTVWVNCWFVRDLRVPFGGAKASGIGREGGRHSWEFYTEAKNVCIAL